MSEFEEPKFTGSLAHREPQYVLTLGLIGSFLVHALALGMVRFAVVRFAGGGAEAEGPAAVEFVAVGADGEVLPSEKVAVVEVPKAVESAPGPEDPDDVAIAAVPKPSPTPSPSPTSSQKPSPEPIPTPIPSLTPSSTPSPTPKPVEQSPVQTEPQEKSVPRSTNPNPVPRSSASPKSSEPKSTSTPSPLSPPIPEFTPTPRPSGAPPPGEFRPPQFGSKVAFFGLQTLPCAGELCTVQNNPPLRRSPEGVISLTELPIGKISFRVVAPFDGESGAFSDQPPIEMIEPLPSTLTKQQEQELETIATRFLGDCVFQFTSTNSLSKKPLVLLTIDLTIEVK